MDDLFSRDSLNRVAKYLLIGVTILLVFFFLLAFLRAGLIYWLWSTVETWVTVRLGLDYYASQLLTMIVVSTVVAVLPTLAWYMLLGRRRWQGTAAMIGGQALIFILVYTIGSGVCFNRQTGEPLCWYADTPSGRYFSATPGFHPTYGLELKPYTREIALGSKPNAILSTTNSSSSSSAGSEPSSPSNCLELSRGDISVKVPFTEVGSFQGRLIVQMWGSAVVDSTQPPFGPEGWVGGPRAASHFPLPNGPLFGSILKANGQTYTVGKSSTFDFPNHTAISLGVNDDRRSSEGLGFDDNSGTWQYSICQSQ